jgi:hypothetical protein
MFYSHKPVAVFEARSFSAFSLHVLTNLDQYTISAHFNFLASYTEHPNEDYRWRN